MSHDRGSSRCRHRPRPPNRPAVVSPTAVLFPTIDFALFFFVVYVGAWLLNGRVVAWKLWILAASYYFYAYWDWHFCFLLLASTVIAHVGATGISRLDVRRARSAPGSSRRSSACWACSATSSTTGSSRSTSTNVLNHVGLGHLIPLLTPTLPDRDLVLHVHGGELRRRRLPRHPRASATPIDLAVYLSFFPHLVAGPIVRGGELLPQLRATARRRRRRPVACRRSSSWAGCSRRSSSARTSRRTS